MVPTQLPQLACPCRFRDHRACVVRLHTCGGALVKAELQRYSWARRRNHRCLHGLRAAQGTKWPTALGRLFTGRLFLLNAAAFSGGITLGGTYTILKAFGWQW